MPYRLGVDVGGTFTDLLLIDEKTARRIRAKAPTRRMTVPIGVLTGIEKICHERGHRP